MRVCITDNGTLFINAETPADENRLLKIVGRDYRSRHYGPGGESFEVVFEEKEPVFTHKETVPPQETIDKMTGGIGLATGKPRTLVMARRPKTCRECVFCSEPELYEGIEDFAGCCYVVHEEHEVYGSRPACHLGELRDEPWPKGDTNDG